MKKHDAIQFFSSEGEDIHSHSEIELIYVLSGRVDIDIQGKIYRAAEHDLMIINSENLHGWGIAEDALMCRLQMDYYQLKQILGQDQIRVLCNSIDMPENDYRKIRYILDCIIRNAAEPRNELVVQSLYYTLWECVKNQFVSLGHSDESRNEKNERLDAVIQDIRIHYGETLSLHLLAERWYVSESVLSRMVKKATGMKFVDFVRKVRLEHARDELLYTEKPIAKIAMDCGFSNPSVFHKNFKEFYQQTPSAFRTAKLVSKKSVEAEDTAITLKKYLMQNEGKNRQNTTYIRRIIADCEVYKIAPNAALQCMNAGMAVDIIEQRVQSQIMDMVHDLNLHYIRISNLFDWDLRIRLGHDTEQLNFDKLDAIFDFCSEIGVIPMLELPEKQRKTVVAVKNHGRVDTKENEPVFETPEEWERIFTAFLEHVIERYTRHAVSEWIFEIAYDIEHSTGAGKFPFDELYLRTYRCIRQFLPEAKIGASELNTELDAAILKQQLLWWKEMEERPQFLSIMCYPYEVEVTKADGLPCLIDIKSDSHFLQKELHSYQTLLEETEYPKTPIWVTEWNTSISERNFYNDSCAKGCHMLRQMTDCAGEVEVMGYGIISDWHAIFYDVKTPLTGGTGLVTKDGLCKPAYFALDFWNVLGDRILKKGENHIITTREDGTLAIVAFNGQSFNESYKMKEENEIQAQDLPYLFREQSTLNLSLHIKNVREGRRKINKYRVRESEGNLLAEWEKMGYVETLSRPEIAYLEKICIPRMENSWVQTENNALNLNLTIEKNEMQLIMIF